MYHHDDFPGTGRFTGSVNTPLARAKSRGGGGGGGGWAVPVHGES